MRFGLRTSLVLALVGILTAVSLLISVVVLRLNERLLLDEVRRAANLTATVIATTLEEGSYPTGAAGPPLDAPTLTAQLQEDVTRLARLPDVEELLVIGPDLRLLASSRPGPRDRLLDPAVAPTFIEGRPHGELRELATGGRVYLAYHPLHLGPQPSAVLRATFSLRASDQQLAGAARLILLYLALDALLLVLAGSYLLDRLIVRPLRRVAAATERIGAGALDPIGLIDSGNEIGRLSVSFNAMVDRIAEQRRRLQEKIAELSQANAALAQARSSMVRAERLASVGTLAAGVAHEVGNPLAAILGYSELLLQEAQAAAPTLTPPESQELLRRIHEQTLRIHRIVRELLDYSRARPATPTGQSDLARAVQTASSLLAPQPRMRGVELQIDLAPALPPLGIEEEQLVQVLVNLLLNAADALAGRGRIRVTAHLAAPAAGAPASEAAVLLRVQDDGPGIPPEVRPRIFDPFFTTKAPGAGTGLGRASCERLLADAGGEIAVEESSPAGTTMRLRLPVVRGPAVGLEEGLPDDLRR